MGTVRVSWWEGHYYPEAGEVVGWRESRLMDEREAVSYPPAMVRPVREGDSIPGPMPPGEDNRERAVRRARTRLRRYAAHNGLNRLLVLTFAPDPATGLQVFDLAECKRRVRRFVRLGLRRSLGYRGAYAVGWERHKSGAWHANLLLGAYVAQPEIEAAWGHGFVHISRFAARPGEGGRAAARRAAAYVAKYVSKEFTAADVGTHRYEVAQGFGVRVIRVYALSASGIIAECGDARAVEHRFDAAAPEAGRGPPIVWAAFGG